MKRATLLAATVLVGCGAPAETPSLDGGGPDANPYAARTYSVAACPLPPTPAEISLCDRGDGQVPRFVVTDVCVREVGGDPNRNLSLTSTHPQYQSCLRAARVGVVTIADVWRTVHGRDT